MPVFVRRAVVDYAKNSGVHLIEEGGERFETAWSRGGGEAVYTSPPGHPVNDLGDEHEHGTTPEIADGPCNRAYNKVLA